ncbi:TPA: aminopeptidase P family protein [Candidatus Poribacteria bacterium]|nr:aminopeptidase P family protein [Candidatus Poribacteria bacterium]
MELEPGSAILIYEASERDSNMFYATGFLAPDKFIYLKTRYREAIFLSDLEIDRARSQSKVKEVLPLKRFINRSKERGVESPKIADVLQEIFEEFGVRELIVPSNFGVKYADLVRERGYKVSFKDEPFFEERRHKKPREVEFIRKAVEAAQIALDRAIDMISSSLIRGDLLFYDGEPLTSERVKREISVTLIGMDYLAKHTIVACGTQSAEPHNRGSGPLRPHQPIVIDLFPKDLNTGYHADMTRTVVRGEASEEVKRMFDAVLLAQKKAIDMIKPGVDGKDVHNAVVETFNEMGFETGEVEGKMQGFFHGTGHGIGLDVHEWPRISTSSEILEEGDVVTVEPGLYYPQIGGVRIEDDVLITENGCEVLSEYPKVLELK